MGKRCDQLLGRERIGGDDSPWCEVRCLLPDGHDGPHADWTAWLGVPDPDLTRPGASRSDP